MKVVEAVIGLIVALNRFVELDSTRKSGRNANTCARRSGHSRPLRRACPLA
jgi:hypothetical protein